MQQVGGLRDITLEMQQEIPTLAEMPLGQTRQRQLSGLRLLVILLGVAAFAALFLPHYYDYCGDWQCDRHFEIPVVRTGFYQGGLMGDLDLTLRLASILVLVVMPLFTLAQKPRLIRFLGTTLIGLSPIAFILWRFFQYYNLKDLAYWDELLPGRLLYCASILALSILAALGTTLRLLLHWSARREHLRRRVPVAVARRS